MGFESRIYGFILAGVWVSFVLVINHVSNKPTIKDSRPSPINKDELNLIELCHITKETQKLREDLNSSQVNPARQVVEELLEIVTRNPEDLCTEENWGDKLLVIMVDTARKIREREIIRNSWGSVRQYKKWNVRTIFLMGQSDYCIAPVEEQTRDKINEAIEEEMKLQEEFERFGGDLVVGAFADTYRNLTYKHLMGYKFVLESCTGVDLIVKTDDDMFVDISLVLDMRDDEVKENKSISDIYCHHYHDAPTRNENGKWFSTLEEWPEAKYPPYCLGNDLTITAEWAKLLYSVRSEAFFWVDDVFIYGKLREIAERKYGREAKRRSVAGIIMDKRQKSATYIVENCGNSNDWHFGLFTFLDRHQKEFEDDHNCLWGRLQKRINDSLINSPT